MRALVFDRFGGPEVLRIADRPDPVAGADEAIVRTRAIGLDYAEVYRRLATITSLAIRPGSRATKPRVSSNQHRPNRASWPIGSLSPMRRWPIPNTLWCRSIVIDSRYRLEQGADAHRHLESRRALGKVLLIP